MRIVGGTARGRRLLGPPKGFGIRPTSDKAREAIFDVLDAALPGGIRGRAIDVFAGTGALGIEALSRGAEQAVFVEKEPAAIRVIGQNLERAGFTDRASVRADSAERALSAMRRNHEPPFELAFFDPPYGWGSGWNPAALLVSHGLLAPDGIVVMEHGPEELQTDPPGLVSFRRKRYGDTRVVFLRPLRSSSEVDPNDTSRTSSEANPKG